MIIYIFEKLIKMKKIKEYLDFLVDEKTLSYVVPIYFSITLSAIYVIVSYLLMMFILTEEIWNSNGVFQLIFQNFFSSSLFTCISIWLYFIVTLWYKLWTYVFRKYIKNNITKSISFFIFLYWTWLYYIIALLCLTIFSLFNFYYSTWFLFNSYIFYYYNIIIISFCFFVSLIELIILKNKTLSLLILIFIIFLIIPYFSLAMFFFVLAIMPK